MTVIENRYDFVRAYIIPKTRGPWPPRHPPLDIQAFHEAQLIGAISECAEYDDAAWWTYYPAPEELIVPVVQIGSN